MSSVKEAVKQKVKESGILWDYFYQISQIPRSTFNCKPISNYIKEQAKLLNLDFQEDEIGNICVSVPASKGFETYPGLTFQAHTDMVCEKNFSTQHDFDKDPIQWLLKGECLYAEGTTLGADNGIGVATLLALMADREILHPSLECLFTVDEEVGLIGANKIDPKLINNKYLINLDNEEEGELCIGCAGGINSSISQSNLAFEKREGGYLTKISLSGLSGGHSGGEIHKGLGNANVLLVKALQRLYENSLSFALVCLKGGNKSNAIPRESQATFWSRDKLPIRDLIFELENSFKATLKKGQDQGFSLRYTQEALEDTSVKVLDEQLSQQFIEVLALVPHGVLKMYSQNLVGTSLNFASIDMLAGQEAKIVLSHRSLWKEDLKPKEMYQDLEQSFARLGFSWELSEGYLPWEPKEESAIGEYCAQIWEKLFGVKARKLVIHAGLECGIIATVLREKENRNLDMISFGPSIRQPHTPHEYVEIPSVERYWIFIKSLLKNINSLEKY